MNCIKGTGPGLFLFFVGVIGGIVFSQGVSFARWSEFQPVSHFIDFHAILISALGFGLMCISSLFWPLMRRIDELEKTVNQLKSSNK